MKKYLIALIIFFTFIANSFAMNNDSLYTALKNYNYNRIDSIIHSYPKNYKSFNTLIKYIKKYSINDQERARASYIWIIDNISYGRDKVSPESANNADSTFKYKVGICEGYSKLFLKFCTSLNIESKVVTGFIKTDNINNPLELHAWNIVYLYNTPFIIESTWGDNNMAYGIISNEIEYYFLANPSEFIYSHFPSNFETMSLDLQILNNKNIEGITCKNNQLLEKPVSIQFFLSTYYYSPGYFRCKNSISYYNSINAIYKYVGENKFLPYIINDKNFKEEQYSLNFYGKGIFVSFTNNKLPNIPTNMIFMK